MKTKLDYHISKFKKRYQFKRIGKDPNLGTIFVNGYIFTVYLDTRKIGRWVTAPYTALTIWPKLRRINIPRFYLLVHQSIIDAALQHEICHCILELNAVEYKWPDTEIWCDLYASHHCGVKSLVRSHNAITNQKKNLMEMNARSLMYEYYCTIFKYYYHIIQFLKMKENKVKIYHHYRHRTYVKNGILLKNNFNFNGCSIARIDYHKTRKNLKRNKIFKKNTCNIEVLRSILLLEENMIRNIIDIANPDYVYGSFRDIIREHSESYIIKYAQPYIYGKKESEMAYSRIGFVKYDRSKGMINTMFSGGLSRVYPFMQRVGIL